MKIKFWGVRGSIASPGPDTVVYGGNTPCVQVIEENHPVIILDAGTGIRQLGRELLGLPGDKLEIHLLFSHTHWDHIQGFPFFLPIYSPKTNLVIYGPTHFENKKMFDVLNGQMDYTYFPVRLSELQSNISYFEIKENSFKIGDLKFSTQYLNHPVLCIGYKVQSGNKTAVYATDNEPFYDFIHENGDQKSDSAKDIKEFIAQQNQKLIDFCTDADLLILDAQYTDAEYPSKKGWGHNSISHALDLAQKAKVKRLAVFHHDPERTDAQVDEIIEYAREKSKNGGPFPKEIFGSKESAEIEV